MLWLTLSVVHQARAWLPLQPSVGCSTKRMDFDANQGCDATQQTTNDLTVTGVRPSRRYFLSSSLVTAGALLTGGTPSQASAFDTSSVMSLPWVKDPINPKRTSLRVKDAETMGYNLEFVTYLTRFLLNFDPLAQQWWIDGASAIPKRSSPSAIYAIRQDQFSRFAASVELGLLQEFPGPQGQKRLLQSLLERFSVSPSTDSDATNDSKQQRLIRETKEARRQLALLFGLLNDNQPTAEITKLLASVDNGSITFMELLDDPTPRQGFEPGDENLPILELSAPQAGEGYEQAMAKPIMTPTGRLLRIDVDDRDSDSDVDVVFRSTPLVIISPPSKGGKAAQARALIEKGSLIGIELTDAGEGYTMDDRIQVRVETQDGSVISVQCHPVVEMQISAVEVAEAGTGYAVEKPVRIIVTNKAGKKDVIGYGYPQGQRGSFQAYRLSGDNQVRTFERQLDEMEGSNVIVSGTSSGGALPPLPFTSKASSSQQLLSLLPQGFGLAYDKERKRYFLMVDNEMVASTYSTSPSSVRLVPDFGPRGESPIERNMGLDLLSFLRLSLAGAICSSGKSAFSHGHQSQLTTIFISHDASPTYVHTGRSPSCSHATW